MLFNFSVFGDFLDIILLVISILIVWKSKNLPVVISVLLYLLQFALWLMMRLFLVRGLWALWKSGALGLFVRFH